MNVSLTTCIVTDTHHNVLIPDNRKARLLSALNRNDSSDVTSTVSPKSSICFMRKKNSEITANNPSHNLKKSPVKTIFTPAAKCPQHEYSSVEVRGKVISRKQKALNLGQKVTAKESDDNICNLYASYSTPQATKLSLSDFMSTW